MTATHQELAVIVRQYQPRVTCDPHSPRVPDEKGCGVASQKMNTQRGFAEYRRPTEGPRRDPGQYITLPKEYFDESGPRE